MENRTCLTNKQKALSIYKWTLRKYLPFSIAYWIMLFITFPMIELFGMIVCSSQKGDVSFWKYYTNGMEDTVRYISGTFFVAVVILFSAILAIIAFSYMHNKRAVDLFGSFPVSRRTLFFSRYFAVITASVVPVIVFGGMGTLLTLKSSAMLISLKTLGIILLEIIGNVSFIAFISLCCGTVADVFISYGIVNIVYPICVAICYIFPGTVIPGLSDGYMSDTVFTMFCPIGAPFVALWGTGLTLHIVWWLALSALLMAGCYVLCKKRKAETAQNAFAFAVVEIVIKFVTCFAAGFGAGWILSFLGVKSLKSQYCWFVIGLIGGIMVANIILHLIFHRGLSKYKQSLGECGVVFVTGLVFLFVVTTGAFGYDMRVPDVEDIKEVSVKTNESQTFKIKGKDVLAKYSSDENIIREATGFHQQITDMLRKEHKGLYPITGKYQDSYDETVKLVYQLENGKTMTRKFEISTDEFKISKELKNMTVDNGQILESIPAKYIDYIYLAQYSGENEIASANIRVDENKETEEKWNKIIDALKKDVKEEGEYKEGNAIYYMEIEFYNGVDEWASCTISIPDTYSNTIKALEETGYANVGYHSLKENYGYEYDSMKGQELEEIKTIYFEVPDNWDEDAEIQCMPYYTIEYEEGGYEPYRLTDIDEDITKCEKVGDNIWKYTIKIPKTTEEEYDSVMFYQKGQKYVWMTGVIKLTSDENNMLTIKDFPSLESKEYYVSEYCDYEHFWVEYKKK